MEKSYRQTYHACVPSGWSNDPNGLIFFNGKYHLFYQHYPYKTQWGIMHWGHVTSRDFVKWENCPIALKPDRVYEAVCGCCSGSAIEVDGKMLLAYTAAQPDLQRQCLAWSDDGIHFTKDPANPVLRADMLHPEVSVKDFRDPYLFRRNGHYYMLAGAKLLEPPYRADQTISAGSVGVGADKFTPTDWNPSNPPFLSGDGLNAGDGWGNLVLCRSDDLYHWTYIGRLIRRSDHLPEQFYQLPGAYECPSYFEVDGTEVVLSSPQNFVGEGKQFQNVHASTYMTGKLDFETGHFAIDAMGEVDYGFDFYAEQAMVTPEGRVVMIAWKEMWDRSFPTQSEGWAGTYTLPRELHVREGRLVQQPVWELKKYRRNPAAFHSLKVEEESVSLPGVAGKTLELSFTLSPKGARRCGVKLFKGQEHETLIYFDAEEGMLVFDRAHSGKETGGRDRDKYRRFCPVEDPSCIRLQCYLDISSVEVFVDGGKAVMTGNVYPDHEGDDGVEFFAEGGACSFADVEKYDIIVK